MAKESFKVKVRKFLGYLWRLEVPPKSFYFPPEVTSNEQMFRGLLNFISMPLRFFGFGIYDVGYKLFTPKIAFWTVFCSVVIGIMVFEVIDSLHQPAELMFVTICFALSPQIVGRFQTFLFYKSQHLKLVALTEKIIENCKSEKLEKIFENWILRATHAFFVFVSILCVIFLICLQFPIIYWLIFGEKVLLVPFELPYLASQDSLHAFILNEIFVNLLFTFYMLSTIGTIGSVICFLFVSISLYEIIKMYANELDALTTEKCKEQQMKELIQIITDVHFDVIGFTQILNNAYSSFYFLDISSVFLVETLVLVAITHQNFMQGYVFLFFGVLQNLIPCTLGFLLQNKSESFYNKLCLLKWYLMSTQNQKSYQMILIAAAKERELSAANLVLNLPLFIEIHRKVYSYYVILKEFA